MTIAARPGDDARPARRARKSSAGAAPAGASKAGRGTRKGAPADQTSPDLEGVD